MSDETQTICPAECHRRFDNIDEALAGLDKKLFKGNGTPPWDVRIDRLEQADVSTKKLRKGVLWTIASVWLMILTVLSKWIYGLIP